MNRKRRKLLSQSNHADLAYHKQPRLSQNCSDVHKVVDQDHLNMEDETPTSEENNDLFKKIEKQNQKCIKTASKCIKFQLDPSFENERTKVTLNAKYHSNQQKIQNTYNNLLCFMQGKSTKPYSQMSLSLPQQDINQENYLQQPSKQKASNQQHGSFCNQQKQLTFQYFFQEFQDSQTMQPKTVIKRSSLIPHKRSNIKDEYKILQKVGEGAFGNVFKCQHKLSQEVRSVKIVKHQTLGFKHKRELLKRQIEALKKLDHPSIIKIFQVFQYQKIVYIVCQFCAGGTLKSYLSPRNVLSCQFKKTILQKMIQGVSYMHQMGIVHRDLKPQNILLVNKITSDSSSDQIDIRIIDFGLSVEYKGKVFKDWVKIGSPAYMAPEAFQGIYSTKTDSWSCGVIMHLLFLFYNPFLQSEDFLILEKIGNYRLQHNPSWQHLQAQIKQIISSLLNLNYVLRGNIENIAKNIDIIPSTKDNYSKHRGLLWNLKNYERKQNFIDFIRYYLTLNKMPQQKIKKFGDCFSQVDKDKNGVLSKEQLKNYLQSQLKFDEKEANLMFQSMNQDSSGYINFTEFSCAASNIKELFSLQNIKQVFQKIDISKKGLISLYEFKHFLVGFYRNRERDYEKYMEKITRKERGKFNCNELLWYVVDKVYLQD